MSDINNRALGAEAPHPIHLAILNENTQIIDTLVTNDPKVLFIEDPVTGKFPIELAKTLKNNPLIHGKIYNLTAYHFRKLSDLPEERRKDVIFMIRIERDYFSIELLTARPKTIIFIKENKEQIIERLNDDFDSRGYRESNFRSWLMESIGLNYTKNTPQNIIISVVIHAIDRNDYINTGRFLDLFPEINHCNEIIEKRNIPFVDKRIKEGIKYWKQIKEFGENFNVLDKKKN